jgi:tetratricopeptide (TPR) repeat protein
MDENFKSGDILDDKYLLVRKLGEGGFGHVYLAQDDLLKERYVALKCLKIDESAREQNLIREMDFLSSLADPHVVGFYHHFRNENNLFLVMEYCPGGSLRQLLAEKRSVTLEKAAGWIIELCGTLQRVHDHGIVHHDLKPENILFSRDGTLKIADFGVANTRAGTPSYMCPELFLPAENISRTDGRIDIYALGVTLLELVTGQNAFSGLSESALLQAKVRLDFVTGELPGWLKEIVLKALHPKPELRFQTMQEFKEAIESKHVPYIFDRKRIQAYRAAQKAEWYFSRRRYVTALKVSAQALSQDPQCLGALITAGKCELFLKRIERAEKFFEEAIKLNPRLNIQKELGWIYLEKRRFPEAISMFHDHLQRQAVDYEVYNLLIKTFYETERYEAAIDLIEIILKDYKDNNCFENNLMLCRILLGRSPEDFSLLRDKTNPFLLYNWSVYKELPPSWDRVGRVTLKSKLIFQEFRHGNKRKRKRNIITIEQTDADRLEFKEPIICIGRNSENDLVFPEMSVSRRHCLLINYPEDVWLHDLGSTQGTYIKGVAVESPVFLESLCRVSIGSSELTILPREGVLL